MTQWRSFRVPPSIDGTRVDVEMGKQMILAWRLDGCTFMRRHPERLTTWRILAESRLAVLGHFGALRRAA